MKQISVQESAWESLCEAVDKARNHEKYSFHGVLQAAANICDAAEYLVSGALVFNEANGLHEPVEVRSK